MSPNQVTYRRLDPLQRLFQGVFEDFLIWLDSFLNIHRRYDRVCSAVLVTPLFECRRDLSSIRLELVFVVLLAVVVCDDSVPAHAVLQHVHGTFRPNSFAAASCRVEKLLKVCVAT